MDLSTTMAGEQRAVFAELLHVHRGIIFKVAGSYCRHPDDRADLAQDIAAQLWQAYPRYDASRPFSTWMYRIALNVAISHLRSQRQPATVPLDEDVGELVDPQARDPLAEQQVHALHRFIHAQPALDRALLLLYLEDRGYREISDILGISETNVATKISRLKQRIRNEL